MLADARHEGRIRDNPATRLMLPMGRKRQVRVLADIDIGLLTGAVPAGWPA